MSKSLLLLGALALSLLTGAEAKVSHQQTYIKYSTITGFFLQDDNATDPSTFDYTKSNLGLINRTYDSDAAYDPKGQKTQWQRFENQVAQLNANSSASVQYKVLYLGRHGEGYHNAAESFFGTPAWNCYWAELDGNSTANWSDAALTVNGITQAQIANNFWRNAISTSKIPTPESYYTSPLTRCLATANITFSGLDLPASKPFIPEVKELFREGISIHTCDRRSNATYIRKNYPGFKIEPGFSEYDLLWRGFTGESGTAQNARSKTVLDQVFSTDQSTFLSITSHSGEISSILQVLGHRSFGLSTGAVIATIVKAETFIGEAPTTTVSTWAGLNTCTVPPVTSLATGGCVCPSATSTAALCGTASSVALSVPALPTTAVPAQATTSTRTSTVTTTAC